MASCCYKLLENPVITRDRAVREKVFHLMGMLIKKYNQALSTLHFSILQYTIGSFALTVTVSISLFEVISECMT